MYRKIIISALLLICLGSMPSIAQQSQRPYPESVFFEPDRRVLAKPGDLVTVNIQGVSQYLAPDLEVRIPPGIAIARESSCTAFVLLDPQFSGNQRATQSDVHCSTSEWKFDSYTAIRSTPTETVQEVLSYNVYLTLTLRVPSTANPGLVFALDAPVAWMSAEAERLEIEILNPDGTKASVLTTPTPPAAVRIQPPLDNGGLSLDPRVIDAGVGESVLFNIFLPRSVTLEVESYALAVYAQDSYIEAPGVQFRDMDGSMACSEGTDEDLMLPSARAVSYATDPLPTVIEVTVGSSVESGQELLVCVEMVGLSAIGAELFSWNASAIIAVS